jgi:hypothetical protein
MLDILSFGRHVRVRDRAALVDAGQAARPRRLAAGSVRFSPHALTELANDKFTTADAYMVLRGGVPQPGEFRNGSWRYALVTRRLTVVVAFDVLEPPSAVVVTCYAT